MFFRFIVALVLLTGISVWGISLEKQNLTIKREISEQHEELAHLDEHRCRLFLETQQLGTPLKLQQHQAETSVVVEKRKRTLSAPPSPPLLEWRLKRDDQ